MRKEIGLVLIGILAGVAFVVSCDFGDDASAASNCDQWMATRFNLTSFPEIVETVPVSGDLQARQFLLPEGYEPFAATDSSVWLRRCS